MKKTTPIPKSGYPRPQGLYTPENEHDACGVGLVVHIRNDKTHEIVESGLQVLEHMAHRGAEGADDKTGDGAGILVQIPHEFILLQGIPVPEKGKYGTGLVFLPKEEAARQAAMNIVRTAVTEQGLELMHVRDVPVNSEILGRDALATEPAVRQLFIKGCSDPSELERRLYMIRRRIEHDFARQGADESYVVSLSTRTIVYKGMLSSLQLRAYYPDLINPYFTSALALVHSRFSTNTFPTWSLAQPFRLLGHNGEINTCSVPPAWSTSPTTDRSSGRA